jgi:uncharacterized membrane protein YeaQ/YmgE (transglycosylase-associated protein family)
MGVIAIIVLGLVAGVLARVIVPGRSGMGIIGTVLLGVVGSFVGGFVGSFFYSRGGVAEFHPTGLIFSTMGAVIVLVIVNSLGLGARRA